VKNIIFIYVLKDMDKIRYVGQTNDPRQRLISHIYEANNPQYALSPNTHKNRWIRDIASKGRQPLMEIIEEADIDNADDREKYWIQYYVAQGCKLTNGTGGGQSIPDRIIEMFFPEDASLAKIKANLYNKIKIRLLSGLRNYCELSYDKKFKYIDKNDFVEFDLRDETFAVRISAYIDRINKIKNPFSNKSAEDMDEILEYYDLYDDFPIEFLEDIIWNMLNE
jgi:predicted GIY-YIG superfamily endonuclease